MSMRKSYADYVVPLSAFSMFLFLYIPVVVLIVFSFNASQIPYVWRGWTLEWYRELWESSEVWDALKNSCIVAFSSVVLSQLMGLLFILYGSSYRSSMRLSRMIVLFYASLAAPEIVLAVALLSSFVLFSVPLGLTTLIAAHTLIGLGYVVPMLYARFSDLDHALTLASLDLGATRAQTFRYVIVPLLMPAVFAASLLVFVVSWDDFIISFFCSGAATQTLPMYIFSVIRSGATPTVNALSTMLLCLSSVLVIIFFSLKVKKTDFLQ